MSKIIIESPNEVRNFIVGAKLIEFEIMEGVEGSAEEAFCAEKEILMQFSNGKEMRIYIDENKNLCVYSD